MFSPLEGKIHIFAPPCNILYIYYDKSTHNSSLENVRIKLSL